MLHKKCLILCLIFLLSGLGFPIAWAGGVSSGWTWDAFRAAWESATVDDLTLKIVSAEGEDPVRVAFANVHLLLSVDISGGVVSGATITHTYEGDLGLLDFRAAASVLVGLAAPEWTEEKRGRFLRQKMSSDLWETRASGMIKTSLSGWDVFYFCTPHVDQPTEEFAIGDPNAAW